MMKGMSGMTRGREENGVQSQSLPANCVMLASVWPAPAQKPNLRVVELVLLEECSKCKTGVREFV